MKIVATDYDLRFVDSYDLGELSYVKTPDQDRFNADITSRTDLYFMEYSEYIRQLQLRMDGREIMRKNEEDARLAREQLGVLQFTVE